MKSFSMTWIPIPYWLEKTNLKAIERLLLSFLIHIANESSEFFHVDDRLICKGLGEIDRDSILRVLKKLEAESFIKMDHSQRVRRIKVLQEIIQKQGSTFAEFHWWKFNCRRDRTESIQMRMTRNYCRAHKRKITVNRMAKAIGVSHVTMRKILRNLTAKTFRYS